MKLSLAAEATLGLRFLGRSQEPVSNQVWRNANLHLHSLGRLQAKENNKKHKEQNTQHFHTLMSTKQEKAACESLRKSFSLLIEVD